jgi:uroporphyrinogen-III synthase
MPTLLVTRPLAQARDFAEALGPVRAHVVLAPLTQVQRVDVAPSDFRSAAGVILTSANAVPFLPDLGAMPAFCVGPQTAQAARAAGLTVTEAGGDAAALLDLLSRLRPTGPLVHATGGEIARDLVGPMTALGIETRAVQVYDALECPWPPEVAGLLSRPGDVVLPVFSPRAGRLLAARIGRPVARLHPVAISAAAAAPLGARDIAPRPDGAAMRETVRNVIARLAAQP